MVRLRSVLRLAFLSCALALLWSTAPLSINVLKANPPCFCGGSYGDLGEAYADAYTYDNTFQDETYGTTETFGVSSLAACGSYCQSWVNTNVGDVACDNAGLEAGQGYVLEHWTYSYNDSGDSLNQQYDCGDL